MRGPDMGKGTWMDLVMGGGGLHLGPGLAVLRVGTKQWNVREGANKSDTKAAERRGCC